jgi:hypothetical protein
LRFALLGAGVLLLPTLGYGLGFDHGFYQYIGSAALRGQWPYTDALDTSFPGAILLHMGILAVGGRSVLALRIADFAIELTAAGLLFTLTRRIAGARAGIYAACAYAIAYTAGTYYHTAERDAFLVPLLLASLLEVWRFLDKPDRRAHLAWAGLWMGFGCLIRPTYALVVALSAALLAFRPVRDARASARATAIRQGLVEALLFAGIAATPIVLFIALYVLTGRGRTIADLLSVLTTVYVHLERLTPAGVLRRLFVFTPKVLWVGAALSVLSRGWRTRRMELATTVFLFLGCVFVRLWESKGYRYQFWPSIAVVTIVAAVGWYALGTWIIARTHPLQRHAHRTAAALLGVVLLVQLGRSGVERYRGLGTSIAANADRHNFNHMIADSPSQGAVASYLHEHMDRGDRVQLWGPETIVLFASGQLSATRFIDSFLFLCAKGGTYVLFSECGPTWNKPIQVAFRQQLMSELTASPPRYIVAHLANGSLAVNETYCIAPDLPELRALLASRYAPAATFGSWTVFELQRLAVSR